MNGRVRLQSGSAVAFLPAIGLCLLVAFLLAACESDADRFEPGPPSTVDVTAVDYAFQAPDTIRSGWRTFRMTNEGREHHHFHLFRLPEGKTVQAYRSDFLAPADSIRRMLEAGTLDPTKAQRAYDATVADWAHIDHLATLARGGVGLVAPGRTGQMTTKLDPGSYVMDCSIGTPNGRRHWALGMIRTLVVTGDSTSGSPPDPDVTIVGAGRELKATGALQPGSTIVKVGVETLPTEVDSAYSVWLARLSPDTEADDLIHWAEAENFENPPPADFLGGVEYVPARRSAYLTVDLSPGRYAWLWFYLGGAPFTTVFSID